MGSFALWFEARENESPDFRADVHINLWNLHATRIKAPSLDIGIRIRNPSEYSKVFLYIPFVIKNTELSDLGTHFKNTEILCTVFNEDFSFSQNAQSKILNIKDNKNNSIMNVYCLDIYENIHLENRYNGTLLSFSRPPQLTGSDIAEYYRFRITSEKLKGHIKCYNPKNLFLQSAFSVVEAIDFRFNDYRSLSPSLLEIMRRGRSYQIGKVHFLFIIEADVDLRYSSIKPNIARELEPRIWKGYYSELSKLSNSNVVAYHWKFRSESADKLIENCIMFVKTKIYKCNWKTIFIYIIFALFLTILGNKLSSLLILV